MTYTLSNVAFMTNDKKNKQQEWIARAKADLLTTEREHSLAVKQGNIDAVLVSANKIKEIRDFIKSCETD